MLGDGGASSFGLRLRTGERCSRRGRSVGYRQTWGGMLRAPLPTLTCLWSLRLPLTLPSPAVVAPSPLPPIFQPLRTLVAPQGPEPQREPTPPPSPSVFQPTGRCFPLTSRGLELVLMHRHCSSPCQTGLRPQPAIWGRPGGSGCGPNSRPCSSPCLPPSGSEFPEGTPPVPSPVLSGSWGICLPSFLEPKQGSSGRPRLSGEGLDLRGLGLGHGDGGPGPSCWPQPRPLSSAFNCCPSVFQVADSGPWPPGPGLHEGSVGRGVSAKAWVRQWSDPLQLVCPHMLPSTVAVTHQQTLSGCGT